MKANVMNRAVYLIIATISFWIVLVLAGCVDKKTATDPITPPQQVKACDTETARTYSSDIDRLTTITEKLNSATKKNYVCILGSPDDQNQQMNMVTIDYAKFDRLGDDGAAFLIARAMMEKAASDNKSYQSAKSSENANVQQIYENTGRCLAEAGFKSECFDECMKLSTDVSVGFDTSSLKALFIKGYNSAKK